MIILSNNDLYNVRLSTLIADYDRETIINLYQPIIGATATSVYFFLLQEFENQKVLGTSTHEQLLLHMQLSTSEFLKARKLLEAVGLVKTYLQGYGDEVKIYEYQLYSPKTPKKFFDDVLLHGTLIQFIGSGNAKRLQTIYKLTIKEPEGNEVSATFGEIFHPDFNDPSYLEALRTEKSLGRKTAKIDFEFSYDEFFEALASISLIKKESITKKEMREIERLATLYGVDVINTASLVSEVYNPTLEKGKRVDFEELTKLLQNEVNYRFLARPKTNAHKGAVNANTDLALKVNLMEHKAPKDYLAVLQNGTAPAIPDLKLIDDLSIKFRLPNGVINALVDFVLNTNNNVLNRSYCEKIAASLAREGITTALDAMNYLKAVNEKRKSHVKIGSNKTTNKYGDKINKDPEEPKDTTDEEVLDWDTLLADIED